MRTALLTCCFTLCALWAGAQSFYLQGHVLDRADSSGIAQASIIVHGTANGSASGPDGKFGLTVNVGDTIDVMGIQIKSLQFIATPEMFGMHITLYAEQETYQLDEVVVNAYNKKFIQDNFLKVQLPPDPNAIDLNMPDVQDILVPDMDDYNAAPYPGAGQVSAGGFSPNLDKKAKHNAWQQEQVKKWMNGNETAARKYDPAFIKSIIPLTDEQLEAFLKFCELNPEFISHATDYEFAGFLKDCYMAFVSHQQTNDSIPQH